MFAGCKPFRGRIFGMAVILTAICSPSVAQSQAPPSTGLFPFVIPQDDATKGTATDMSFLSAAPAGSGGRIVPRNGHFVEAATGRRVRFFGLNTMYMFPDRAAAGAIAGHLAKMGVNLLRFHMADPYWSPIWKKPLGDTPQFDPAALDKLDYFVYQLKQHGIYLDLNLHAGRQMRPEDGFAPSVQKLPEPLNKHIDMLDVRMIALDQQFDREYLTHVNPYTHLSYAVDPAVAILEVNNEDTMIYGRSDGPNSYYRRLPEPFRTECMAAWNAWLARKYGSTASLRQAWFGDPPAPAAPQELLSESARWLLEDHVGDVKFAATAGSDTARIADIDVVNPSAAKPAWRKQMHIAGLDLVENAYYKFSLRVKSDKDRSDDLCIGLDEKDWRPVGLNTQLSSDPDWRTQEFVFQAKNTLPKHSEISITVGGSAGEISLADVRLTRMSSDDILPASQTVEARSIDLPAGASAAQQKDWTAFLSDTELAYADKMRAFLRNDVGARANIVVSQVSYGGMDGIRRELDSDFADNHLYYGHPTAVGAPSLDKTHWKIPNKALVNEMAAGNQSFLYWLSGLRLAGKPYTVSEYNHPAPSDYQAEAVPLLTSFSDFQDWDGIFWFADKATTNPWFDTGGNPTKEAFFPACSAIMRMGEIPPATRSAVLTVSPDSLITGDQAYPVWKADTGAKLPDLLKTRTALAAAAADSQPALQITGEPAAQAVLSVEKSASGGRYIASGPAALACVGFVGGQIVARGPVSLTFPQFGNGFAAMTLTACDGKPLNESRRLLLTIVGHTEKAGQVWNADRTSVGADWGDGPALAEGIPATVALANPAVRHVYALDPTGARVKALAVRSSAAGASFTIAPDDKTVWYELAP